MYLRAHEELDARRVVHYLHQLPPTGKRYDGLPVERWTDLGAEDTGLRRFDVGQRYRL